MSPYGLEIGDRVVTPAGYRGTVAGFPAAQGFRAVLVELDDDKFITAAVYPHSTLRLLKETPDDNEGN